MESVLDLSARVRALLSRTPSRRAVLTSSALASAAVALTAGVGALSSHADVMVEVDGVSRPVSTWGGTVADVLDAVGVSVGEHDLVSPGPAEPVADGDTVVLRRARAFTVTVDGERRTVWSTAASVDSLLADAGRSGVVVAMAADRSAARPTIMPLVSRPQHVRVVRSGVESSVLLRPGDDVRAALVAAGLEVAPNDRVSLAADGSGLAVHVDPVVRGVVTTTVPVPFTERTEESGDYFEGESVVTTRGEDGEIVRTAWQESVGGTVTHEVALGEEQVRAPKEQVRATGTKKVSPIALIRAGIDPKAELEEGQEPDGTTSVRYRAPLGSLSSDEEIAEHTVADSVADVPLVWSGEDPRSLARPLVAERGWSDTEFQCLVALWNKESHWNPYAHNTGSGAYGIPQALPGSKMASAGADWQSNPVTQIRWGLGYIAGRYGTPCGAWSHSRISGWY